jgi:hypothetical protein
MELVKRKGLRSLLINLSLSLMVRIFAGAKKGEKEEGIKNYDFAGLNISRSSLQLDESAEEGRYTSTQRKKFRR